MKKDIAKVQYITPSASKQRILSLSREFLEGGGRWIQLRCKKMEHDSFLECAHLLRELCNSYGAKLIINDNIEVARCCGADGVHLGSSDAATEEARRVLGSDIIIGRTANSYDDILSLVEQEIDYIGLGPFRFTTTKENLSPIVGLEGYKDICGKMIEHGIAMPVVAVGGILAEDIRPLLGQGLFGVAISGAISGAESAKIATEDIIHKISIMDKLIIGDKEFSSRLFTGTGKFSSSVLMESAINASESELVTVALKRVDINNDGDDILSHLKSDRINLLPNTSGVRSAREAVFAAELAREALGTNFIKLEIHPDQKYLMPDGMETLVAAKELVEKGFVVMPYIHADPVLCKRLEDVGVACVMPLGSPIGSNKGLATREFLRIIIEQSNVPVVVDAGIGTPSHAAAAMEMGASAVLVNTAIAASKDPVAMAVAFKMAVEAGRMAYLAQLAHAGSYGSATSPLTEFLKLG